VNKRRIIKGRIRRLFPKLAAGRFQIASRKTDQYNCIAWAAGTDKRWWEPTPGYFWPNGVAGTATSVATAVLLYESLGFIVCDPPNAHLEEGFVKVAIFGNHQGYTHAARQLENGKWASKLGALEDIEHDNLDDLTGSAYGEIKHIMKKDKGQPSREEGNLVS